MEDTQTQASLDLGLRPEATQHTMAPIQSTQCNIILRRQRMRPKEGGGLKLTTIPSRFLNLSNDFEYANWGSVTHLKLDNENLSRGKETLEHAEQNQCLGQFTASALTGTPVLGGVFYTLPAVIGVAGVYSPICLFIAPITIFLWRPILEELASALPISGAPYTYLLNISSKAFALVGAALLLLDFASTSVTSAATAASYLAGEIALPFPAYVGAFCVLVAFTAVNLSGIRESARVALVVLSFHIATMMMLAIASIIAWTRIGNQQLMENWNTGHTPSAHEVARQIFIGFCIAMLGLTGFECAPAYAAKVKPGRFPLALRNVHFPTIILGSCMSLLSLALVPLGTVKSGANILSNLAHASGGKWLRLWVVTDAMIILCGGVLTGTLSSCELLEQLAQDRVLPQIFLLRMPRTRALHVAILCSLLFSIILYASTGANLIIMSKMFSMVWLTVMTLFPVSLLLLKFNRGRLQRREQTPLFVIVLALVIAGAVFAGNIVVDTATVGYFAAYFFGLVTVFAVSQNKTRLLRSMYWAYDQHALLHSWRCTRGWGQWLVKTIARLKSQPVCVLAKTDEIDHLFQMIIYVCQNEDTSCLKIVHFYRHEEFIPSEIEANAKILDEAFPEITIDLILVNGEFEPGNVAALAHKLCIPRSLMFMSCPGVNFPYRAAQFGTRIITL